jgi:hypothetical protein
MTEEWAATVRTLEQAREFVLGVGVCGVLGSKDGMPTLWDAVDAPEKQAGEGGWGDKMGFVWSWKNLLPATYPDEVFYGKRRDGRAILCSMTALRELYRQQYKPLEKLSDEARLLRGYVAQDELNNGELKTLSGLSGKANKSRYDRALNELQVAFQIVRVNRTDVEGDTWTLFEKQYPDFSPDPCNV